MLEREALAELIYCLGWIAIGAAIVYSRRRKRREAAVRRLAERLQEGVPIRAPQGAPPAQPLPAGSPAFAGSLARLAAAAGQSVPVAREEEKAAPQPR